MMLEEGESALPAYVNHTFDTQNHSERDPLIKNWIPPVVAPNRGSERRAASWGFRAMAPEA